MKAVIHLVNNDTLDLDEYGTEQVLKLIHMQELGNSLIVLHIGDKTGKFVHSIPMTNVLHIDYLD